MHGLAALLTLPLLAAAHGVVNKPVTRPPGAATQAACGKNLVDFYKADNTSYPEAFLRNSANPGPGFDSTKCNMWLCKGFQYEGEQYVQKYTPGQKVDFEVKIRIAHTGYANVSVVDLKSNKVIGAPLAKWASYAESNLFPNLPKNETSFSVTIPNLAGKCTKPGECAIQWYWLGQGQTYENCVDFTVPAATGTKRSKSWTA